MSLPIVYHPDYVAPLPPGHRFPMLKYRKLYELLIRDGIAGLDQFYLPEPPPQHWIELAHHPTFVETYLTGTIEARAMRRIGLPWSRALVHRTCIAVAGTVLTAELALQHGIACNTAGGTHHAFADFGSGFCIFNDMAPYDPLSCCQRRDGRWSTSWPLRIVVCLRQRVIDRQRQTCLTQRRKRVEPPNAIWLYPF